VTAKPVLSLGETLIDLIASDGATRLESASAFVARPGGAPANAAVALARLGVPSAFCGVVGDDPFGAKLRAVLSEKEVDVSRLRSTRDAETTIAFAWKDERGDGHFRLLSMADHLLDVGDVERAEIAGASAIVVGSCALPVDPSRSAIHRAVELAAGAGVPVCFDVNVRPSLWPDVEAARAACSPVLARATMLKMSLDDARFLFDPGVGPEEAIQRGAASGARFVVLTDGARGAWFHVSGREFDAVDRFVPAFAVDAIEPTGAGDAFCAGIIQRLIARDWVDLTRDDVVFASAAGAITTTRRGAMEALPTRDEVQRFVGSQS
jgi:fructokinase